MRAALLIAVVALGATAPPVGSGSSGAPDGSLVMGVLGRSGDSGAVTREWVAVADPRSGAIRRRRVSGGALCHGPVLAAGDRVVFSGHRGRQPVARALPLTLEGRARALGTAETFVASRTRGGVWLGRWRAHSGRIGLRQVDASGRSGVRTRVSWARWSVLHADLGGRLFVVTRGRWLTVWDAARDARRLAVRDGWFAAAAGGRLAWCRGRCGRLQLWTPGERRTLVPPAGVRPIGPFAAFSPDGGRLAVAVRHRGRSRVAVVDVASGAWSLVPGGRLGGYQALAWSPLGGWLYFTAGDRSVMASALGTGRAVRLPIEPGGTVMSLAAAG